MKEVLKKERKSFISKRFYILTFLLFCLIIGIQYVLTKQVDVQEITSGWSVKLNNTQLAGNSLNQIAIPLTKLNDKVEMSTALSKTKYSQVTLAFQTRYSVVQVFLDDTELYQYGEEEAKSGEWVLRRNHRIALPENYAGCTLRIVLLPQEDNAFSQLPTIELQESGNYLQNAIYKRFVFEIVSMFVFCAGLAAFGIMMFLVNSRTQMKLLVFEALFSLSIGIWMICYSDFLHILTDDTSCCGVLEYMALYATAVFLLLFVFELFKHERYSRVIEYIGVIFAVTGVVSFVLNQCNIIHFSVTVSVFHVMVVVGLVICILMIARWLHRKREPENMVFAWGVVVLYVFIALEMIRYILNKYAIITTDVTESWMPIGVLIFVMTMIINFGMRWKKNVEISMERDALMRMAYTDALTNIGNRACCDKIFRQYEESNKPVIVLNMDLNHFKAINDNYGHAVGDELLIRFAYLLEQVFGKYGAVGRMGGDEFVVILDYCDREVIEGYIKELMDKVEADNAKSLKPYKLSVAYGWADNFENSGKYIWKVYEEADRRMYEQKRQQRLR